MFLIIQTHTDSPEQDFFAGIKLQHFCFPVKRVDGFTAAPARFSCQIFSMTSELSHVQA